MNYQDNKSVPPIRLLQEFGMSIDPRHLTEIQRRRLHQVIYSDMTRHEIALSDHVTPRSVSTTFQELAKKLNWQPLI